MFFSSIEPLAVWLYDDGFTKLTNRPYSLEGDARKDPFRHLTNPDVLDHDPQGNPHHNGEHELLRQTVRAQGGDDVALFRRIRTLVLRTALAGAAPVREHLRESKLTGRRMFELMGFDVTVDQDLVPWLLECNTAPSLKVEVGEPLRPDNLVSRPVWSAGLVVMAEVALLVVVLVSVARPELPTL